MNLEAWPCGGGHGKEKDLKGTASQRWRLIDGIRRRDKSADSKVSGIRRMETAKGAWLWGKLMSSVPGSWMMWDC